MKTYTYYVPVEIRNTKTIKVEATSQLEAISKVEAVIHNNDLRQKNDFVNVIYHETLCDNDDEIIESIKEDFNVDLYNAETHEGITHEITIEASNKENSNA